MKAEAACGINKLETMSTVSYVLVLIPQEAATEKLGQDFIPSKTFLWLHMLLKQLAHSSKA